MPTCWGVENFFPHPNELLNWHYPENLVKIGLIVEASTAHFSTFFISLYSIGIFYQSLLKQLQTKQNNRERQKDNI